MNNVQNILSSIKPANTNFINSSFEHWYNQQAKSKGSIGEKVTRSILEDAGDIVEDRLSKEHDLVVNGKKVEVKTAFQKMDETFVVYGYDPTEDPHYWYFTLVYPSFITIIKMDRNSMANIYLGKTRKNVMATVTEDKLLDAGGEIVGSYLEG